ncbi:MAG: DNA-binding protein [Ignavibacteria bacterium RBG_16_34_14]|nr:MAG: DNA-binding protein [Ignavibacteria bacterium RBG_16_34_14]
MAKELVILESVETKILFIRGQKVILDKDLAGLYGVATRDLNKAVSRNISRFPSDFMFQLNRKEFNNLKFQFGTSSLPDGKAGWGGTRKLPYAFTEQGIAMLSSVLRSERAVQVNIVIMRAFVKLREILSTHKELAQRLKELELKIETHDEQIIAIFEAINQLLAPPEPIKRKIGFEVKEKKGKYVTK